MSLKGGARTSKWANNEGIARVAEDSGTETAERVRARLEGYDADALTWRRVAVDSNGRLIAELETSDIQIGAVEVKDGGSDNRAAVSAAGAVKVDGSAVAQPVTDNSGSLTVDAPVGTPVFVRLSDGSAAIATLPVSLASVPSHAVTATDLDIRDLTSASDSVAAVQATAANLNAQVVGSVASGAAAAGNPVLAGTLVSSDGAGPTLTAGNRGEALQSTRGGLKAILVGTNGTVAGAHSPNTVDGAAGSTNNAVWVAAFPWLYNGATFDKARNGGGTEALALRVTLASDSTGLVSVDDNGGSLTVDGTVTANAGTGTFTTKETRAATPTVTQVGDSATNVTLLASNANRLGATIYNDSSAVLRIKMGATASATSFTVLLAGNGSGVGGIYEVPFGYTGILDGIWATDAGGNAYVTELVA